MLAGSEVDVATKNAKCADRGDAFGVIAQEAAPSRGRRTSSFEPWLRVMPVRRRQDLCIRVFSLSIRVRRLRFRSQRSHLSASIRRRFSLH
jgi:hypothetical protein